MKRLFRRNGVMDVNIFAYGRERILRVLLSFLLVYMIGELAMAVLFTIAQTNYLLTLPEIQSYYSSGSATAAGLTELVESIKLPDWFNVVSLFTTLGTVAAVLLFCLKIEKRTPFALGLSKAKAAIDYPAGLVIGATMLGAAFGIVYLSGGVGSFTLNGGIDWLFIALMFLGYAVQAFSEELVFRAFLMPKAARTGAGVFGAVMINSLAFAALHLGNNGVDAVSVINVFLFGIFASLLFLRTGSIWGVAAIHASWNFVQGNLLGINVSGVRTPYSVFVTELSSNLFSGRDFGLEGGFAVTIVFLAGIAILLPIRNRETPCRPFIIRGKFFSALPAKEDFAPSSEGEKL
ncbi:MAG: CPBP family intramembrane metalloprotease [Clostridia bacterium]|nr:CPBP family intramembrane metalloprotease [Clostridia bacterium]